MSEQNPNKKINWYPGHMARSRRLLQEQLRAVDAVVELCDARAPRATRNADLNALTRGKSRLLALNKADLALRRGQQRVACFACISVLE